MLDTQSSLLVLNPETPAQYAYNGQWSYVNSSEPDYPNVMASVVVGNETFASEVFSLLSAVEQVGIPHEAFRAIVRHLESAGFIISGGEARIAGTDRSSIEPERRVFIEGHLQEWGFESLRIPGLSAAQLAQVLPPIYFDVVSSTHETVVRLELLPEDYIDARFQEIHVIAKRAGECTIGTSLLRRVGIHIDSRNRRIGFAEPVDEI